MSGMFGFYDSDNFVRNMVTIRGTGPGWWSWPMEIRRTATSEELCVDPDDVMLDLRVDDPESERATIERYIRTACAFLEKRAACVCLRGEFEIVFPGWWYGPLEVRRFPVREIIAIEYLAGAGDWQAVPGAEIYLEPRTASFNVELLPGYTRPDLWSQMSRTRLRFAAGWDDFQGTGSGETEHPIQEPFRGLITGLVGHFIENRELFQADKIADVEMSAGSLLSSVRQFW